MERNVTFKADFVGASVLIGIFSIPFFLSLLVFAKFGWAEFVASGWLGGASVCFALPIAWTFWLSRFRMTFGPEHLEYRSGFGRAWSVPYSNIQTVKKSSSVPISKSPIGAVIQLKSGEKRLLNLKVFPIAASLRLFEIQPNAIRAAA